MVATPSTMLKLGTQAPSFSLPDSKSGTNLTFDHQLNNKGYLIAFICNHCPYVIHLLPKLTELCNDWTEKGIQVYFISSNDIENYPADSPKLMKELSLRTRCRVVSPLLRLPEIYLPPILLNIHTHPH